jgi:hypothetical protein
MSASVRRAEEIREKPTQRPLPSTPLHTGRDPEFTLFSRRLKPTGRHPSRNTELILGTDRISTGT